MKWEVGDLVKLSANEEKNLFNEEGWTPEQGNDWELGIIIKVCSNHGNHPFYQVHWTPANEVIEESHQSVVNISKNANRRFSKN